MFELLILIREDYADYTPPISHAALADCIGRGNYKGYPILRVRALVPV